jgi:putative hydrolase of HD superfamily
MGLTAGAALLLRSTGTPLAHSLAVCHHRIRTHSPHRLVLPIQRFSSSRFPVFAATAMDSSAPPATSAPLSPASAIQFLTLIQRLKTTKRTGWVNHGVKESESIADHMYRMAVMAMISGDLPGVNKDRCVKMAVVHDIAEAIVGDITPNDNIPKEEKNRLETAAIDEMCILLEGGIAAEEVKELWLEYENNSTPEAKFVKDLDKLEMILQAVEYENEQNKVLDDFFRSTEGKFQTDLGKAWAAEIRNRRPKQK